MTTGERIASERRRHGFTQVELATLAKMHPMALSKLERGVRNPSPESLAKLAAALWCREAWLRYGAGRKAL